MKTLDFGQIALGFMSKSLTTIYVTEQGNVQNPWS